MCWDKEEAQPGKLSTQQSFSPTHPKAELSQAKTLLRAGVGGAIRQGDKSRSPEGTTCRRQEGSSRDNLDDALEKKTTFLVNIVGHMCCAGLIEVHNKCPTSNLPLPTTSSVL